ncbi:hypothetical protein DFE_0460 [Desulfovibrio ferrophilus]|uniref:Uncharacterized protein n=1 Tax=Desulfovibrio ferrophilus TaxID=241368 RepID=A0A2Z6AVH7_9BACT|nr:hypothetical protein DFE_0460 [Desulfovibrio ferrophilus]
MTGQTTTLSLCPVGCVAFPHDRIAMTALALLRSRFEDGCAQSIRLFMTRNAIAISKGGMYLFPEQTFIG